MGRSRQTAPKVERLVPELEAEVKRLHTELDQEKAARKQREQTEAQLRQGREALDAERQRLFSLLDELPAFVYLQRDDYTVQFANRYLRETFGNPEGVPCYKFFEGRESPCRECHTQTVFDQGLRAEWEWAAPGGRVYQVYGYPFTDIDGLRLALVMGIDITKRKKAEEALGLSEARYRSLVEKTGDAVFVFSPRGRLVEVNPAACRMLGYQQDELLQARIVDVVPAEDLSASLMAIQELKRCGAILDEIHLQRKDGTVILGEISATVLPDGNYMGTVRDITERKKAEDALRESEERYRQLVELSPDAIVMHSEGKVVFANAAAVRLSRATGLDDLIGQPALNFVHPESRERVSSRIKRALETGETIPIMEHKYLRCDGSVADVEVTGAPMSIGGKPAILAVIRDITELRGAEEFFEKAFYASPYPMCIQRIRDRCFMDVNDRFVEVIGYQRDDVIGKTLPHDLIIWDKVDRETILSTIRREGITNYEVCYRKASGDTGTGLLSAQCVVINGEECVLSAINDVTERKRAREALRRSEERYRCLVENMQDGVFLVNSKGRFIEANPAACRMMGYSREELLTMTLRNLSQPKNLRSARKLVNKLIKDRRLRADVTLYTRSGTELPAAINATVLENGHLLGTVRDITDRKRAEDALRESEERYRLLVEHSRDAIFLVSPEGALLEANPAACRMLGYSREELLAIGVQELMPIESLGKALEFPAGLRTLDYVSGEIECQARNGHRLLLEIEAKMLPDGNILCTARDITERKKTEEMKRELERFDRLDLLGQMAAGIAHEVRNPMTVARGFIQMLGEKPECQPHRGYLQLIIDELDRANGIISEYLALARVKPPAMAEQNLNTIIETMLPLIRADAVSRNTEIVTMLGTIPVLLCDEREIRQLILNLTRNGVEAMADGGVVTITTSSHDGDVLLAVRDQGPGIPPEIMEKLGTPFVSTKERGTGLGLSTCYSIADRHDAAIKIETGTGGTTVLVRFKR